MNEVEDDVISWKVIFYFGVPSDIRDLQLDGRLLSRARKLNGHPGFARATDRALRSLTAATRGLSSRALQEVWSRSGLGVHPFQVMDRLGEAAVDLQRAVPSSISGPVSSFVWRELERVAGQGGPRPARKLKENTPRIFCGLVLGSWFNSASILK
jgi:hypothetical protein